MHHNLARERVKHLLLRPAITVYVAGRARSLRHVPIPRDASCGRVPGRNPIRIAVVGDATAVGYGTMSQQLGVAAHFARQLSRRDERGVEWATALFPRLTIRTAAETITDDALVDRTDKFIIIVGLRDAIGLMPVNTWAQLMHEMLTTLRSRLPGTAHIMIAEIPPLKFYSSIPAQIRWTAAAHARQLNATTRHVAARHQRVCTVPLNQEHVIDLKQPGEARVSALYSTWAQLLLMADSKEQRTI